MKTTICFIINPLSGTGKWKMVEKNINRYLNSTFAVRVLYTQHAKHATQLAKEAAETASIVVAVGGDGMVNEVANGLLGTSTLLGIIPTGSGNALARHLGIPLDYKGAIECINQQCFTAIDHGTVNQKPFFAVCGTGYDAEIANRFATSRRRGFFTYLYLSFMTYFSYQSLQYQLIIDGKIGNEAAFLITVANSSQYGNRAYIAPGASVQDGWLDVCIVKPFPFYLLPKLAYQLFAKKLTDSSYFKIIKGRQIEISKSHLSELLNLQYDGETHDRIEKIIINIQPKKLLVIVPKNNATHI